MTDFEKKPAPPLEGWLAEAVALAREHGLHDVLAELTDISGQLGRPVYRITVAGEAMSGTSALIGRLAGPPTGRNSPLGDGTELVEAPALNQDPEADESTRRLAHHGDALVMTTKAIAPFGLTEADFVAGAFGRGHLRRIALVLTQEGQLPEDRRASVMEHIRARAARLDPGIAVFGDRDGLDALRSHLRSWAEAEDRIALRRQQITAQLADVCERMAETGREEEAAARRAAEEAGRDADRADTERAGLRAHIDRRRTEAVTELRERLERERAGLLEELRRSLEESPNAKHWWDTSLSYELHKGLQGVAARQAEWFRHRVEAEALWLTERLSALDTGEGPVTVPTDRDPDALLEIDEPVRQRLHLEDLGGKKLLYRLGPVGAALVTAVALPGMAVPIVLFGSAAGLVAGDARFHRLAERQRSTVREALTRIVRQAVEEFADTAARHVRSVYHDLAEHSLTPRHDEDADSAPEGPSLAVSAAALRARLPAGAEATGPNHD
ncbi:hypothetical protein GCM10020221_12960 [Streptomyces thioluteus]|uniref:Dynamin family protein n=1 Tax=Streptomyces thioluteus TaxID=66431 RepID=A0ABN3WLC4_STRTU